MGHTCMTTQGDEKHNYNNHPFLGAADMPFALAHNGIIHNDLTLRKEKELPRTKIETDSYVAVQMLEQLADRYPLYIPVSAAADYLHIKEAGLRAAIEQGTCPFGISWRLGDRAAFKIPTLTFIAWMTKGAYALSA